MNNKSMINGLIDIFYNFVHYSVLAELSVDLMMVLGVMGIMKLLKQPLIIGYLIAGVLVGPGLFDIVSHLEIVETFSHMGIGLLLFMVGLGLSLDTIKEHGKTSLYLGSLQIVVTVVIAGGLFLWSGLNVLSSLLLAIGLAFSSTIVIVKLLGDKNESLTLYGRLSTGILIVQDMVVMLLLMGLSMATTSEGWQSMLVSGIGLLGGMYLIVRYFLPRISRYVASSSEFLLLFVIGWCFMWGTLFEFAGFSLEIGTLLAGMAFATSPYRLEIMTKLKSLRDFFLVLFFVMIGMDLGFAGLEYYLGLIGLMLVIVVIIKPLLIVILTRRYGYTRKTCYKTGLALGQVSEFSFLIVTLGLIAGYLTDNTLMSVVLLVALMSIFVSTYATMNNEKLVTWLITTFHRHDTVINQKDSHNYHHKVLLFGYGKMGSQLGKYFHDKHIDFVVVDNDPFVTQRLTKEGIGHVFADGLTVESYVHYLYDGLQMVVSTMRDIDDDMAVIRAIKDYRDDIIVIVIAQRSADAVMLYEQGADYVVLPHEISAHHTSALIEEFGFDMTAFVEMKLKHREILVS